jgi:redox-sensitive bicupin YhaK (pirin superfamily)
MTSLQAGSNFNWKPNSSFPNLWIQMIEGETEVNGRYLEKADGLGIENFNKELFFSAISKSKFFIFFLTDEI